MTTNMELWREEAAVTRQEVELWQEILPLKGARVLELGCGRAEKTRMLVEQGDPEFLLALEVDRIQHEKNLAITDLPKVRFDYGGAEDIPAEDASFDIAIMFRSLHHVPVSEMDRAMAEIHRVLRPGGLLYISEPVYGGNLNAIICLFHDEKRVREEAFAAEERSVKAGLFSVAAQHFLDTRVHYPSFAAFEDRIIKATHTQLALSEETYAEVKRLFESHIGPEGALFQSPVRIDLLRRE